MTDEAAIHFLWILAAAGTGFSSAALFAGVLRMRRQTYLVPYIVLSTFLIAGYLLWSEANLEDLLIDNLLWGIAGALIIGALMVMNVLKQPASPRLHGWGLAADMTWSGAVYGVVDALLLAVIPVLATKNAFSELGWSTDISSQLAVGLTAIATCVLVTVAYHLGYPEFRNSSVRFPALGMAVSAAGYLVASNPFAAIGSHVMMHIAVVAHGTEKTLQLPPHYAPIDREGRKSP